MLSNYYLMLNECFLGARGGPGGGGGGVGGSPWVPVYVKNSFWDEYPE